MEVTDRELLIRFEGKLEILNERIEGFTNSLNSLSKAFENFEGKKVADLERRINELTEWKQRMAGAWVVILFAGGLITTGVIAAIKWISNK